MNYKFKYSLSVVVASLYYIWALLPIFTAEYAGGSIRIIFFGLLVLSIFLAWAFNGFTIERNTGIISVIFLFFAFLIMKIMNYCDASNYMFVVYFFWLPYILNIFLNDRERVQLTKVIIILLLITTVTSAIGVFFDSSVARTIAHATSDRQLQISISRRNVAGIYLFQMLVVIMPAIMCILDYKKKTVRKYLYVITTLIVLIRASFSIAVILAIVVLLIVTIFKAIKGNAGSGKIISLIVLVVFLLGFAFAGEFMLNYFSKIITNERVSIRILEIKYMIYGGNTISGIGDGAERLELYLVSINTFLSHFFTGAGAYYSFIKFDKGIGFHSQIFDDLARYGFFAVWFYVSFFRNYYRLIKKRWKSISGSMVAPIIMMVYILFLILNLGFRSDYESAVMFFVIPNLPLMIKGNECEIMEA